MTRFRLFGEAPAQAQDASITGGRWRVAEELPVAIVYNKRNYAVMLSTPADLEDFAIGFSLTECVVDHIDEVSAVDIHLNARGVELQISIAPDKLERLDIRQQRRNLVGRAGCGLCGLENADTFFETLPQVAQRPVQIEAKALNGALASFTDNQPLNDETHSVHAAAWADKNGVILYTREDVGRHNALDKLLGALARADVDRANGFVLMSSRCSYEIVEKAARMGVAVVASISAPTAFAIRKAAEANLSLYARNGEGFVQIKTNGTDSGS